MLPLQSQIRRRILAACALATVSCAVGCTSEPKHVQTGIRQYLSGQYPAAAANLSREIEDPNRNYVLSNLRAGSARLASYDIDGAQQCFLAAYEVTNAALTNDPARRLSSVVIDEQIRVWKGEYYERAMLNYYLGLTYYLKHDYNNARAAFENALVKVNENQDEKEDVKLFEQAYANFPLPILLLGRCYQQLGREDQARVQFDRLRLLRQDLAALADEGLQRASNVVLIVEYGRGPRKVRAGDDGESVAFGPTPQEAGSVPPLRVLVDGQLVDVGAAPSPLVDTLGLAQDRRWQTIDTVRKVKSVAGTGLLIGGAVVAAHGLGDTGGQQRTQLAVGAGLAVAGLLLKASSQADIRHWELLPRSVMVVPLRLSPGPHRIDVQFPNPGPQQTWLNIPAPQSGDAAYYFRMNQNTPGPYSWPPNASSPPTSPTPLQ